MRFEKTHIAMVRSLNDTLSYIGVDDLRIDLFESQYPVPEGISYNSYVLRAGKTAVFDTVDASASEQWKANLGIEVTINQQPFKNRLDAMQTGNFDVVLAGWVPDYNDPMTYLDMFMTTNGNNYGKYSNEQYDSPEFKNAKESVKIALGLKQQARLNTGTIEIMPESIEVGGETNIMFPINNTGKVMLYNVTAIFEADSIQRTEAYVGNVEPGKSGNVDVMVAGTAPTMDDGKVKLTITYEDEAGEVSSVEKEIQLYVTEPVPMEDMMDVGNMDDIGMMEPEEPPYQKYLIPGAAGAVLLIVVIVIIRRKKKKA